MSIITQQAWANKDTAFFLRADVSTLNVNSISTGSLTSGTISTNTLSSGTAFIHDVEASTLYALTLQLDNQVLTATPAELLLNGIPLATTSNLSSIADWAFDPAISTLQMNGNNILNASTVSCITLVADQGIIAANLNAGNGIFSNLIAFNSMFVSTQTSTISSVIESADLGFFSTLNADNISSATSVMSSILTTQITLDNQTLNATPTDLLLNGVPIATVSSLSTIADWSYDPALTDVNMNGFSLLSTATVSTQAMFVSSINGAEFTSTTITVQVAGVSSLVANSISSIGAELRTALVSTLQFNPSFSPSFSPNVNLGLGSILGNVIGWGAGVFGAAAGTVGMATGIASLAMGRQQDYIDNTKYELINGTTQIQFSTLGDSFSTIYRFNDSADPERIPGSTIYVSTISPPGLAVRAMSDPINTVSTPNSTIQAFGQWVPVPLEPIPSSFSEIAVSSLTGVSTINGVPFADLTPISSISSLNEWALFPALSTIVFDPAVGAVIESGNTAGNNLTLIGSNIQLVGAYTDSFFKLVVSTVSTAVIKGSSDNILNNILSSPGLVVDAQNVYFSSIQQMLVPGNINGSTIGVFQARARDVQASTINLGTDGVINILEGNGSIQLGISGSAAGSLTGGANPSLTLDGATSEVAVPTVNTDNLGGKNFTTIDVAATLNMLTGNNINFNGNLVLDANQITIPLVSTIAVSASTITANSIVGDRLTYTSVNADTISAGKINVSSIINNTILCSTINATEQIFVGPNGLTGAEIVFIAPNADQHKMDVQNQDRAIRYQKGSGAIGYFLDTSTNPPFFSTINNQVNLVAYYPSTNASTIGISTISKMNPVSLYGRSTLAGGTVTVVFSPPYANSNEYSVLLTYQDNAGGSPLHANILSVSSFSANGSTTNSFFWQTIGRV